MLEREQPRDARYKTLEDYHATIPGSVEGWGKAEKNLETLLLQCSDEASLPEGITIIYADEPKAMHLDFVKGHAVEMDLSITMQDGKPKQTFTPTGAYLIFRPAENPEDRIQRVEDIKDGIEDMLQNNPPKVHIQTN